MGREAHFFLRLDDSKIEQFENRIDGLECAALCDLTKTGIDSLDCVSGVHYRRNKLSGSEQRIFFFSER